MARGGKRAGTPGQSYGRRTDLHQPIRVAPNQEYGQAQALENAQRVVPLPNQPVPAAQPPAPPPAPTGAMGGPPGLPPPDLGPLSRPTERPGEPVTAGLPTGPGPGPEVLGMGSQPFDPTQADAQQFARYLPALEFMASQPDASMSTRNFVRRLRSIVPVAPPPGTQ